MRAVDADQAEKVDERDGAPIPILGHDGRRGGANLLHRQDPAAVRATMIHLAVTVAAVLLLLLSVALVFWRPLAILLVFGLLLCATVLLIALKEPHRPRGARSVTDVEAMLLICGLPRGTQAPPFKHGPTCDQWMADYRAGKIKPDWKAAR